MFGSCLRKITIVSLIFIGAIFSIDCTSQNSNEPTPILSGNPNTTYPMPPVSVDSFSTKLGWTLASAEHVTIDQFRGRVLVLDFYATWCAPCRNSIPQLKQLERRFGPQGLAVIGLNVGGPDDRIKVQAFANELQIQYPLGFPDKSLIDVVLSDDDSIPQTFVFDRQGRLLKRFIGYDQSTAPELERVILTALAIDSK